MPFATKRLSLYCVAAQSITFRLCQECTELMLKFLYGTPRAEIMKPSSFAELKSSVAMYRVMLSTNYIRYTLDSRVSSFFMRSRAVRYAIGAPTEAQVSPDAFSFSHEGLRPRCRFAPVFFHTVSCVLAR
jgi:hypothetical protein